MATTRPPQCDTWWGSHGCDLPPGHEGPHRCVHYGEVWGPDLGPQPCCEVDSAHGVRHWHDAEDGDPAGWSDWDTTTVTVGDNAPEVWPAC